MSRGSALSTWAGQAVETSQAVLLAAVVARVVVARLVVARVVVEPEVGRRTCLSCSSSPQRQPRRFFALTLFLSASALAQSVPTKFSFTARMVDNGAPVQGTRDFVFRLFPALTSGSEVWTETRNGVSVVDGVVNLELGASTPLTDTVFDGQTLYLEVTASGTVLAPRTPVLSVAYALRATVAGRVGLLTEPDIQKRVTTSCALGSSIRAIASDGTVTCQAAAITVSDGGTVGITGVYGGAGLTGGAATGDVNLAVNFSATGTANTVARSDHNHDRTYLPLGPVLACNSGDKVVSINPTTGNVVCGADTNSTYGAAASGGLAVSGSNQFSLTACLPNQLLVAGAGGTWVCTTQSSGGVASVAATAPLSSSGGANPTISLGTVPVALGGTGGTTALAARQGIGAAASGANADITSLTGLSSSWSVAQGGTGGHDCVDGAPGHRRGGQRCELRHHVAVWSRHAAEPSAGRYRTWSADGRRPVPQVDRRRLERSATLELRLRNLEKRVFFESGAPTGCESNLLHETLGRSLVEKGKLTDAQHHTALAESAVAGKSLQVWLLEKQLVSAFELFRHLQATLGRSLLDAFRWTDATWKLAPPEDLDAPVRINPLQLIYTGCQQLPVSALTEQLATPATTVFGLLPDAPAVHDELKLSAKETRLLQAIKRKATLAELSVVPGLSSDDVHRRLYALRLLEFIDTVDAIAAMPVRSRPTPVPQPEPIATPAAQGLPFLDDDTASQNLLVSEFLSFRSKDAFELLGVDVDTQGVALQRAFLGKSAALVPLRFKNADARARAEALQLAYAKAFGALSESDTWQQHRARRAARDSKAPQAARQKAAADAVKIRTDLLDAQSQFDEGRRRLAAGNARSAREHFQFALDIEPKAQFLAWLAWSRYQLDPNDAAPALEQLARACEQEPNCEEANVWRGDLAMVLGRASEAEGAYRHAIKLAPKNAKYVESMQRAAKAARR